MQLYAAIKPLRLRPLQSTIYLFRSGGNGNKLRYVALCSVRSLSSEEHDKRGTSSYFTRGMDYLKSLRDDKEVNTIPNIITMSRIVACPGLAVAIACDMKIAALGGCLVFGFTDWLDGYLARKLNQRTTLGTFLDPLADKIMIGSLAVGLTWKGLLPLPLLVVILGRDAALVAASFMYRAAERPKGARFFDTTDSATFKIQPSEFSRINTGVQFALLSATLSSFSFGVPTVAYLDPLWWITATTTLGSGLMYLDGSGVRRMTRTVKDRVKEKVQEAIPAALDAESVAAAKAMGAKVTAKVKEQVKNASEVVQHVKNSERAVEAKDMTRRMRNKVTKKVTETIKTGYKSIGHKTKD